jgi:integrase
VTFERGRPRTFDLLGPGRSRWRVPADDLGARPVRAAVRRVCRAARPLGRSDAASASGVRVGSRRSRHMIWSTPKTHQSRDVPIPRSLIDALLAQAAGNKPEDVLFNSPNGEPIRLANWRQRVWDPAVAVAGLTGLTPHDLRHTAASLAIASGASVKHKRTTSRIALTRPCWKLLRPLGGLNPRRRSSNCLSAPPEQRPD